MIAQELVIVQSLAFKYVAELAFKVEISEEEKLKASKMNKLGNARMRMNKWDINFIRKHAHFKWMKRGT